MICALPAWIDNALYAPAYNCVYMPALNMISPVTNPSYGDAYNYAVLGPSTIGHELFDVREVQPLYVAPAKRFSIW